MICMNLWDKAEVLLSCHSQLDWESRGFKNPPQGVGPRIPMMTGKEMALLLLSSPRERGSSKSENSQRHRSQTEVEDDGQRNVMYKDSCSFMLFFKVWYNFISILT